MLPVSFWDLTLYIWCYRYHFRPVISEGEAFYETPSKEGFRGGVASDVAELPEDGKLDLSVEFDECYLERISMVV